MKKKLLLPISIILVVIIILLVLLFKKNDDVTKIDLSLEYYNSGQFIKSTSEEVEKLLDEKKSFLVYTYNNFCSFEVPCEEIFKVPLSKYNIDIIDLPIKEFRKTRLFNTVKFAPSVVIINKGEILAYLDADSDDDYNKYQNTEEFEEWLLNYVNIK